MKVDVARRRVCSKNSRNSRSIGIAIAIEKHRNDGDADCNPDRIKIKTDSHAPLGAPQALELLLYV